MNQTRDFYSLLTEEFEYRKKQNPNFSLRKFADQLNLSPSYLSKVFHRKRNITLGFIIKVGSLLKLSPQEIENQKVILLRNKLVQTSGLQGRRTKVADTFNQIDILTAQSLNEWTYFAILELFSLPGFTENIDSISEILQISQADARRCIDQLVKKKLLIEKDGALSPAHSNNTISKKPFTNKELIDIQKQFLMKSILALETVPLEQRDHSGVTVAISTKNVEKAKKLIKDFRRKFMLLMEKNPAKNSVYQMSISFYPLTQIKKGMF